MRPFYSSRAPRASRSVARLLQRIFNAMETKKDETKPGIKSSEGEKDTHAPEHHEHKGKDVEWSSGTWDHPVDIDPESYDPLTIARMTDHNVRGIRRKKEAA